MIERSHKLGGGATMANLFLPYDITIREVTGFGLPNYAVDIATSSAGIETRTLISNERANGYIDVVFDNELDASNESLEEFHLAVRTNHLSFVIRDDHNLWELIPQHTRRKFLPMWRFEAQLTFSTENARACLYLASMRLFNVKI